MCLQTSVKKNCLFFFKLIKYITDIWSSEKLKQGKYKKTHVLDIEQNGK